MYRESFRAADDRNPIHTASGVWKSEPASVMAMDITALAALFYDLHPHWELREARGAALWYHLTGGELTTDVTFLGYYPSEQAARAAVREAKRAVLWQELTGGKLGDDLAFVGDYWSEHVAGTAVHDIEEADYVILEFPEPNSDGHTEWYKIDC